MASGKTRYHLRKLLPTVEESIRALQAELAETNRGLIALSWELEQRVDERTRELRAAHEELQRTNAEFMQLTLELDDRVTLRTEEIRRLNEELEGRVEERTAELATVNKELETFSYSISHDLRIPLRHIGGFSKILVHDFGPVMTAEALEHLRRIQDAIRGMELMVDALLKMAILRRQSLRVHLNELNPIVDEAISMLQTECAGRHVEWRVAKLPAQNCDPTLMAQVFQNLLGNALKYSRDRSGAVIEVDSIQQAGKPAIIFVRDNGVGFNMKYAEKLFGVFQRFHTSSEFEGTGVGLATVHRIIQKHGGMIWAEAEVDHGATFYFTLQVAEQIETTPKATTSS